ncbi:MAG: phage gp6-like head-tail connector protein [Cryomorphaceae bacterium]|nr:MAG: phage gp6-like head-tail connector protein [Cryomorphaceae bacterium]
MEQLTGVSVMEKRILVSVKTARTEFMLPQWPVKQIETVSPDTLTEADGYLDNTAGTDIEIEYITEAYILPQIKQAILNLIGHWYITRDMSEVPDSVYIMVQQIKRSTWFA